MASRRGGEGEKNKNNKAKGRRRKEGTTPAFLQEKFRGSLFNEDFFFLPSKFRRIITGIAIIRGTFLLNLSDEELSHFLTTLLVRCIAFLHAGYYNLTILGHILFYEVLKYFLKLLIALDHHLLYKMRLGACAVVPLHWHRLRSAFLSFGFHLSLAISSVSQYQWEGRSANEGLNDRGEEKRTQLARACSRHLLLIMFRSELSERILGVYAFSGFFPSASLWVWKPVLDKCTSLYYSPELAAVSDAMWEARWENSSPPPPRLAFILYFVISKNKLWLLNAVSLFLCKLLLSLAKGCRKPHVSMTAIN